MALQNSSRRSFLGRSLGGLGTAWLSANWPEIIAAHEHARQAAASDPPAKLGFFTPDQAMEVEAIAAQIIPTDDTPGAREARVIYFIDRALATFDRDKQPLYVKGLELLQAKTAERFPAVPKFSTAGEEQQIAVLKALEKEEFFDTVRLHVLSGLLCDPARGGNFNQVGWKLIGFDGAHVNEPPFGHYDRGYPGWTPGGEGGKQE